MVNDKSKITAVDVGAIISPALAAVGTVAAGIFGYSLGSQSTSDAQQIANRVTQEMSAERQKAADTTKAATPLVDSVQRIVKQAQEGNESEPGNREQPERGQSVRHIQELLPAEASKSKGCGDGQLARLRPEKQHPAPAQAVFA